MRKILLKIPVTVVILSDSFLACKLELAYSVANETQALRKSSFFGVNGEVTKLKFFSYINAKMAQSILCNFERRLG